jgi:hypothetical protein
MSKNNFGFQETAEDINEDRFMSVRKHQDNNLIDEEEDERQS